MTTGNGKGGKKASFTEETRAYARRFCTRQEDTHSDLGNTAQCLDCQWLHSLS